MSIAIPPPPFTTNVADKSGAMTPTWQRHVLATQQTITTDAAPADARYVVATANPSLTAEVNLGALSAGYLKQTVAVGVASPSTTTTIPAADIVAAGSDTEVQINDGGALGSTDLLTVDAPNNAVGLHGLLAPDGDVVLLGLPDAPTAEQTVRPTASTGVDQNGAGLHLIGGAPTGTGRLGPVLVDGAFTVRAPDVASGTGYSIDLYAGANAVAYGAELALQATQAGPNVGGAVVLAAGDAISGDTNGGSVTIRAGSPTGIGTAGQIALAGVVNCDSAMTAPAFIGDGAQLTALTATALTYAVVPVTFADSPYAVLASDSSLLVNATGGAVSVTLPTPTSGRVLCVKKVDSSVNAVTLTGTVDGAVNPTLGTQYQARIIQADGSTWNILGQV